MYKPARGADEIQRLPQCVTTKTRTKKKKQKHTSSVIAYLGQNVNNRGTRATVLTHFKVCEVCSS